MLGKLISNRFVIFFFSAIGLIVASDISISQVRFDKPANLSDNPSDSWNPNITAVDDQVFVFWHDQVPGISDILLAHSTDRGVTFRTWNLTNDYQIQHSLFPRVAAEGKHIYVGWPGQGRLDDRTTWAPYLSRSDDSGESFHPPFDISGRAAYGTPIMRIKDGIVNVAWAGLNPFESDILFSKSTDFGKSFSEPVRVSSNPPGVEWRAASNPELSLDGDQIYVAWQGARPRLEFHEVYFGRSTDGGNTFSETINLSNITEQNGITDSPQVGVGRKGYVYVAWVQGVFDHFPRVDIYFARSTDGGETFSQRLNLSNNPEATNAGARMVVSGDNIYIVWGARSQIFFSRSTDAGQTFSEPRNISNSRFAAANSEVALIERGKLLDECITEDVIYVVWQDARDGNSAIYFSASLDSGATFSEPQNISNNPSFSNGPRIAGAGTNVYVTWMDNPFGNWDALYVRGQLEPRCKIR